MDRRRRLLIERKRLGEPRRVRPLVGPAGEQGLKGDKGEKGDKGPKGDKGDKG